MFARTPLPASASSVASSFQGKGTPPGTAAQGDCAACLSPTGASNQPCSSVCCILYSNTHAPTHHKTNRMDATKREKQRWVTAHTIHFRRCRTSMKKRLTQKKLTNVTSNVQPTCVCVLTVLQKTQHSQKQTLHISPRPFLAPVSTLVLAPPKRPFLHCCCGSSFHESRLCYWGCFSGEPQQKLSS